jgi:plasmid stabilization system protein ParE
MAVELVVTPEAEQDVADAYGWYEGRRFGLGEEFFGCVDACLQSVVRNPELHQVVRGTYRRALVRRFPYAVFYEYGNEIVTVYCIVHTARNADKWRGRLP